MSWQVIGRGLARPDCEEPILLANRGQLREQRCRATSTHKCKPCAETYRKRVRRIAVEGCKLYTGLDVVMITLTAPGTSQHTLPSGDVCPCTPEGGVHLAEWNGTCSIRFSRLIEDLRRSTGVKLQYFRAAEVQKRGALHFHILVRIPKGRRVLMSVSGVRRIAMKHGFGHSVDVTGVDPERGAWYATKAMARYVSKSATDRGEMPWLHRRTGEVSNGNGRYRVWTASRDWGPTMAGVRAAQASWWAEGGGGKPAEPADAGPLDSNGQSSASPPGTTVERGFMR